MERTVVLFCGKAGVGKTTSAMFAKDYVNNKRFMTSDVFNFAYAVKECAKNFFGWNEVKDNWGRYLLQEIGKFGRSINKNTWIYLLIKKINDSKVDIVFIDDCRFPNELKMIKDLFKTYVIRIEAPNREILKYTSAYDDPSETSLPSGPNKLYDITVWNTGTIEELEKSIKEIVDNILDKENE